MAEPPPPEQGPIARDFLALDRTQLANERTLLAYTRTALAFLAAGLTLIHFFPAILTQLVGWIFIPMGLTTILIGIASYRRAARRMRQYLQR